MEKKKKRKRLFIILGSVILLLIIVSMFTGGGNEVTIETGEAETRTITEIVSANGKIQPETEVIIGSDVSGEIIFLGCKEGDQVKKGDTLAIINPDLYESALNRSVATLNNSKANLANSNARLAQAQAQFDLQKLNFDRQKQLYDQGVISLSEFENAESTFLVAEAELEAALQTVLGAEFSVQSAMASVTEAQDNLNRTMILAPMDGTVSRLAMEEGERVMGSMGVSMTEIMRLANLDAMEVSVDVNENDIVRVELGDTATIEVDAYMDRTFKGIVTEIANSATTDGLSVDQVTNFTVKIRILRSSYEELIPEDQPHLSPFRPGMSANVEVLTETASDVVAVPIESVTTRTDTSSRSSRSRFDGNTDEDQEPIFCVFVYENGKAVLKVVETGIQDSRWMEVTGDIEPGDEIITGPYDAVTKTLRNGDKVDRKGGRGGGGDDEGGVTITVG